MKSKGKRETEDKGLLQNPLIQLTLLAFINVLIFTVVYHTVFKIEFSATVLYFDYASRVLHGSLPYRDFTLEYPPFSLLFFILPRLLVSTWPAFSVVYQAEVLIFDLIGLYLIYLIACRLGKAPWKLMLVYTICILAMGPIEGQQFDIFPAVMTLAALYFFWVGKHGASWTFLALGALTKAYPVAIAPIFLIYYLKNRQYKNIAVGLITFTAILIIIITPFLIFGSESIINLLRYHSQRGLQLESIYSAFLLIANLAGWLHVGVTFNYGSINLVSPVADFLARASTYISALALLITYWFIWTQMKPGKSQFTRLGAYSLLVIDVILVTSKILSPQYLIWLIPFFPLLFGEWRYELPAFFVIIGLLTYFIFPVNYIALEYLQTPAVVLLLFRDILLIFLAVLTGLSLQGMKASD